MTQKEKIKFEKLNAIHPKKQTPLEKYEFYLLLGKIYLHHCTFKSPNNGRFISGMATLPCAFEMRKGVSKTNRKTKKYTQSQKKFNRDQGNYALKKAENIKKRYKLNSTMLV